MAMTITQVIDETFNQFAKFVNATHLGERLMMMENGRVPVNLTTYLVPTIGERSYLVSKAVPQKKIDGMPELSIAYTNFVDLNSSIRSAEDVIRMFTSHLIPPGGEKVGLLKCYGTLFHCGYNISGAEVKEHQISEAKIDIGFPMNVAVLSEHGLDHRFTKVKVLKEAEYSERAWMHCFGLILDDLKKMPTYKIRG